MSAVWALDLPHSDKFVLLALADNANDEGHCWPSIRTIEQKTSLSNRAVRYAVKRLEECGHLVTKNRNGHSLSYTITPRQEMPGTPARDAARQLVPRQLVPQTPAPRAATPATHAGTPAPVADITIKNHQEPSSEPSPRALTRACRIPEDFELTPQRKAIAEGEHIDASRTFATFVDYWRAVSGEKARKHDWDATWRNWCRRQSDGKTQANRPRKTRFEELTEHLNVD